MDAPSSKTSIIFTGENMNNKDLPVSKAMLTPEKTDQTRNESMVAFKKELREEISKLMHSICVQYDNLEMRIQRVEEKMEKVLSKLKKKKTMMDENWERDAVRILRHIGSDDNNKRATEEDDSFSVSIFFRLL